MRESGNVKKFARPVIIFQHQLKLKLFYSFIRICLIFRHKFKILRWYFLSNFCLILKPKTTVFAKFDFGIVETC